MSDEKILEFGKSAHELIQLYLGEDEVLSINKDDLVEELVEKYKELK